MWRRHGVTTVSLPFAKLGPGDAERVAAAGLRVVSVLTLGARLDTEDDWPRYGEELDTLVGAASTMGARYIALTSGSAGAMPWDEAVDALGRLLSPFVARAPVPVIVEHTNQLRSDLSFVFRLRDTLDVARALKMGVLMETTACWGERDLEATLADGAADIALVHVSDLGPVVLSTPDRLVPGDGVIPLTRMAATLLAAGYEGPFELEFAGPHIEAMGYDVALARALPATERILAEAAAIAWA